MILSAESKWSTEEAIAGWCSVQFRHFIGENLGEKVPGYDLKPGPLKYEAGVMDIWPHFWIKGVAFDIQPTISEAPVAKII
jgi:hypothetical protein